MEVYLAELVGTAILVLLGNGVVAGVLLRQSKAEDAGWVVITFAWGLAVAIAVYVVGPYSGAHINPAVTIGLAAGGLFDWGLVPGYLLFQFLGAALGQLLVIAAYRGHYAATDDFDLKLATFSTAPAIRNPIDNLVTEIIGTFMLLFGILGIGANAGAIAAAVDGGPDVSPLFGGIAPFLVGLLIVVLGMSLGGPTGYALNPARDLGPRIVHAAIPLPGGKGSSDWSYAWVPVVGPIIGGVLGVLAWRALAFTV
jgi:glycerol uptake facilitator protein